MILSFENIGKVKKASVEINGITVIAGENNTGKSTVGKVLYSIFNSFSSRMEDQVVKDLEDSVKQALDRIELMLPVKFTSELDTNEIYINEIYTNDIAQEIVKKRSQYKINVPLLKSDIRDLIFQMNGGFKEFIENYIEKYFNEEVNRIMKIILISDEEIFKKVFSKKMKIEFNGQINNIFSESEAIVELQIKGKTSKIIIDDNNVITLSNKFQLNKEIIYIDDPFVLDETDEIYSNYFFRKYVWENANHRNHLKYKLYRERENNVINEIITDNKLDNIYKKINTICSGEIVNDKSSRSNGYRKNGSAKLLKFNNLSTGLKTFIILKTLLQNGSLEENGTIILDEPEIHLHPEWQLLFAELIVLIQKEFNMHILLNTHSPYFLNAIEVYSKKYEIADKCKYYLAKPEEEFSIIEDVTNNIEAIYSKLARPLQRLENERYNNG